MSLERYVRYSAITFVAAFATGLVYFLDENRTTNHETEVALAWARQLSSQVDGLSYTARERSERDPLGWALRVLNQTPQVRMSEIQRVRGKLPANNKEAFGLDPVTGMLEYTRILSPEEGEGIRIRVPTHRSGFLGARSAVGHDAGVLGFFSGLWFFVFLLTRSIGRGGRKDPTETTPLEASLDSTDSSPPQDPAWAPQITPPAPIAISDPILPRLTSWIGEARPLITRFGTHLRDLLKANRQLEEQVRRSQHTITALRNRIHAKLSEAHRSTQLFKEMEQTLALAATQTQASPEAARLVQRLQTLAREAQAALQSIEQQLEPWTVDADLAFHTHSEVAQLSRASHQELAQLTEAMIAQAALLKQLSALATPSRATEKPAA